MQKVLLVLAALPMLVHGAVKCVAPDGSVSFQDAPCTSGRGEVLKLDEPRTESEQDRRIAAALASGKVLAGMSAAQIKRAWGSPNKINASIGSYGRHEQWVYERPHYRNQYLYVENGVLTSIQSPE